VRVRTASGFTNVVAVDGGPEAAGVWNLLKFEFDV
jgi:hypothetical protein